MMAHGMLTESSQDRVAHNRPWWQLSAKARILVGRWCGEVSLVACFSWAGHGAGIGGLIARRPWIAGDGGGGQFCVLLAQDWFAWRGGAAAGRL